MKLLEIEAPDMFNIILLCTISFNPISFKTEFYDFNSFGKENKPNLIVNINSIQLQSYKSKSIMYLCKNIGYLGNSILYFGKGLLG